MSGSDLPAAVVAIDVGGTGIKGVLIDDAGHVRHQLERVTPVAAGPTAVIDSIRLMARELAAAATGSPLVAAGLVVPGIVDRCNGVAKSSANIGWRDVPLRDVVAAELGVPVALEHDVRAAGLAERVVGRARGVSDCLVLVIGTGIAGAVIIDGDIRSGTSGIAGEIGHLPVYPDGDPCACGLRGCLEAYASAGAVRRRYLSSAEHSALSPTTVQHIASSIAVDPDARRAWQDAAQALGIALAAYTMLLDPALIVLSGGLAEAGPALRDPVRKALSSSLGWHRVPAVEVSPLAARAGRAGAAIIAWNAAGRPEVPLTGLADGLGLAAARR